MPIVTITLGGKEFKLSCSEESKHNLLMLAQKLDVDIREMAAANPQSSLEFLLVMMALKSMDQKQSQIQISVGEILASERLANEKLSNEKLANERANFQNELSSIMSELEALTRKIENVT